MDQRWQTNGWRTSARKPVKNEDLWRRLADAIARHEIEWHWVRGHSGHPENERADQLARLGVAEAQAGLNDGPAQDANGG